MRCTQYIIHLRRQGSCRVMPQLAFVLVAFVLVEKKPSQQAAALIRSCGHRASVPFFNASFLFSCWHMSWRPFWLWCYRGCLWSSHPHALCVCAFDGFLLWVRIAYACPTIASLCNNPHALTATLQAIRTHNGTTQASSQIHGSQAE